MPRVDRFLFDRRLIRAFNYYYLPILIIHFRVPMKTNRKSCYAPDAFVTLHWNGTAERSCETAFWMRIQEKREIESEKNRHRSKYRKSTFQCIAAFSTWKWIVQNKKIKLTHIQTEIQHTHTHASSLNPMCSERKYRKKSVCVCKCSE